MSAITELSLMVWFNACELNELGIDMKNGDKLAYPVEFSGFGQYAPEVHEGMTKREMIAMHAMQGLLASETDESCYDSHKACAKAAVNYTDALLKELEK